MAQNANRRLIFTVAIVALVGATAAPAYAGGSGVPWEAPLEQVVESITGPVARAAAVIAIIISGIGIIFGEGGGGIRQLAFVGLGKRTKSVDYAAALKSFVHATDNALSLMRTVFIEARFLDDTETLTYLHDCIRVSTLSRLSASQRSDWLSKASRSRPARSSG